MLVRLLAKLMRPLQSSKVHTKYIICVAAHVLYFLLSTALHDQLSVFTTQKVFILVSTILTWARSKPIDPVRHAVTCMVVGLM